MSICTIHDFSSVMTIELVLLANSFIDLYVE